MTVALARAGEPPRGLEGAMGVLAIHKVKYAVMVRAH